MKFIKFGGTYCNVDRVSAIEVQCNEKAEVCLYLVMPNGEDNIMFTTDITGLKAAEILNQKLFKFLNYKNSPGVFDLRKQLEDIYKEEDIENE